MNADDTIIRTQDGVRITTLNWDDVDLSLNLQGPNATFSTLLTRDEVQRLIAVLQNFIDAMEAA